MSVSPALLFCQQDAIPGRPFLESIPASQAQIVDVFVGGKDGLAVPDAFDEVAKIFLLVEGLIRG